MENHKIICQLCHLIDTIEYLLKPRIDSILFFYSLDSTGEVSTKVVNFLIWLCNLMLVFIHTEASHMTCIVETRQDILVNEK